MTNSFWREVLDHMPGLFLIFRIDDKEEAHLIFVNFQVQNTLGFKPEEFVLASETQGSGVQSEVNALVEEIAEKSRGSGDVTESVCHFHSKRAVKHTFFYEFRIFSVKSSPLPFIAVSLTSSDSGKKAQARIKSTEHTADSNIFVAESPLMRALMQKVDDLADKQMNLLFRGDRGTGKRTLARQVLQAEHLSGAATLEWDIGSLSASEQDRLVSKLYENEEESGLVKGESGSVSLLIIEISKLSSENQTKLLDWIRARMDSGQHIRILATTRYALEEQVQSGGFSPDLYYLLSFDTVLLPPLTQRKEDIRKLARNWIRDGAAALGLGPMEVSDRDVERLVDHNWTGNFHEFYEVLRASILRSGPGVFRLALDVDKPDKPDVKSSDSRLELKEVVPFDEMNRRYLASVLETTGGKIYGKNGAAHLLDMKPTTLQSKLKKLGVR